MRYLHISLMTIACSALLTCSKKSEDPKPVLTLTVDKNTNLLVNGDMEGGQVGPTGWSNEGADNDHLYTWATEQASSNSHSLKATINTAYPSTTFGTWYQIYHGTMPVGKDLIFTAKIKANLVGSGISLVIRGDDTPLPLGIADQFSTSQNLSHISGNFDWTDYQVKMVNLQSNIQTLIVYFVILPNTTGTVYFDDATLTYY